MKLGTVKNYPRRKIWVVLARNKETGELASLGYYGRYNKVTHKNSTTTRPFYVEDSTMLPLKFSKASYRELEAYVLKKAANVSTMYRLKDTWEVFISRVGSVKCPVRPSHNFNYKPRQPIQLTLKEKK